MCLLTTHPSVQAPASFHLLGVVDNAAVDVDTNICLGPTVLMDLLDHYGNLGGGELSHSGRIVSFPTSSLQRP